VIHDSMPYYLIQGQGRGSPKAAKMADFKVYFAAIHVIKRLAVYYDKRRHLNYSGQIFIFILVSRYASRDLKSPAVTRSLSAVPYGAYLFLHSIYRRLY